MLLYFIEKNLGFYGTMRHINNQSCHTKLDQPVQSLRCWWADREKTARSNDLYQRSAGQLFAIEASHSDSATFQSFLDEANKTVLFQRTNNILIVDNATWHRRKDTN